MECSHIIHSVISERPELVYVVYVTRTPYFSNTS